MSTYYSNAELDGYRAQLANYEQQQDAWQANVDQIDAAHAAAVASYQQSHSNWVTGGRVGPEPQPPVRPPNPPQPQAPATPTTVFQARDLTAQEQINTPSGPALVLPLRVVLEGGGREFALSEAELDASYTPTSDPLPTS